MSDRKLTLLVVAILALASTASAQAAMIYATGLGPLGLVRGDTTIGDFAGFYGGDLAGAFPVPLSEAQATAAVLGAPDGKFLSLPGNEAANPTAEGAGFKWAYVDLVFGTNFYTSDQLVITELGNNLESAYVFIWSDNGGNVQTAFTRGTSDTYVLDLAGFAGALSVIGGTYFTHVTIGGQDLLGASQGFDLDAVAINRVPEPGTLALLGLGLAGLGLSRRRKA
jgi:hypothetical protein